MLPKNDARPSLDKERLGELIDVGDADNRSKDLLGRVYEYFLTGFALAEGKNAGQFYTPRTTFLSAYRQSCRSTLEITG